MAQPIAPTPKVNKEEALLHLNKLVERQETPKSILIAESKARQERIAKSKWIIKEV